MIGTVIGGQYEYDTCFVNELPVGDSAEAIVVSTFPENNEISVVRLDQAQRIRILG